MAGPTGTERMIGSVVQSALDKALKDPNIAGYIETFLKAVSDIKDRQARVEFKLDEILTILRSNKDPHAVDDVLDRLALMAPEELEPLESDNKMMGNVLSEIERNPGFKSLITNTRNDLPSDWLLKTFADRRKWLDNNP